MSYILATLCIGLMVLCLMLLFIGLPGNWVILGLAALWSYFSEVSFGWQFFLLLGVLAVIGEILEFLAGSLGARRFGGTRKGSWGGIIGAIAGGILCAPLFFGFGALLGALGGAFTGCFVVEKLSGMETRKAASAALGSALGRFGGFLAKLGIGICMIYMSGQQIWGSL